jgi:uncharacterized protein (TIGR02300 family)
MPKAEWGVKRVCPTTGKRFYDLNRTPIVSPYTGDVVVIDLPGRKGSYSSADTSKAKVALAAELETDDVLIDDEDVAVEAEDELLEDEDDDTVSFDELSDVAAEDEEP